MKSEEKKQFAIESLKSEDKLIEIAKNNGFNINYYKIEDKHLKY